MINTNTYSNKKPLDVVYFDSTTINLNSNLQKPQGVDIAFENISYSVEIVDEEQSGCLPFNKKYKKK